MASAIYVNSAHVSPIPIDFATVRSRELNLPRWNLRVCVLNGNYVREQPTVSAYGYSAPRYLHRRCRMAPQSLSVRCFSMNSSMSTWIRIPFDVIVL